MEELKIVITGCMGSGKSTAIQSISDIAVINTDVDASDEVLDEKDTTTVALDYGEVCLEPGQTIKLYGTPGQRRFDYMWDILAEGALGIIILLNHQRSDPLADLAMYLENFSNHISQSTAVIGVTHVDGADASSMLRYYDYLADQALDYPIFSLDARDRGQVKVLIEAMAAMISLNEGSYEQAF
jgi:signal recognition particle receptor subunit beta